MTDKLHDILRWAQLIISALGTFYMAIASIWGLPFAEQVTGTAVALTALLTAICNYSSSQYFKQIDEED